ncbi:MAG: carbamoyltransferase HypF [Nitriliruptorales bacterium]|nr:carbamoyltransferase HypF [Nitriliruptorales bacterium]
MSALNDPVQDADRVRRRVRVAGIVQGVGFRPFVYGLATDLGLAGFVGNDSDGVFIELEGSSTDAEAFLRRLPMEAPPLAVIEDVDVRPLSPVGARDFEIVTSERADTRDVLVPPDMATCQDCLAEIADPTDRRYRYPFTNCTNCGPRYTIIQDVPYDRPSTTMSAFEMCADCEREYHDPGDRRFHAQPTCCPRCGPRLRLVRPDGSDIDGDPIPTTARLLRDGQILAIKGLGGYHLAVDACNEQAAATLRARKHREDKPFAVMVRDPDAARELCEVSDAEAGLLLSPSAPIVLLPRREGADVAESVAPRNRSLGLMLPYTPLHHLLLAEHGGPIVLTSGNLSDEPIAYRDDDARERLGATADAFLTHDRPIHIRVDDSVTRVLAERPVPLRRSRGFVPHPVRLTRVAPRHALAVGAELKNTVCLAKGRYAFVSHHIGDLENYETFRSFTEAIGHLGKLFDIHPQVVAYDLHPEYLSTKHALELEGVDLVGVQHHHAHIASCLADNDRDGPVIGLAFDGTGYGTDGTIWGGEVLVATRAEFERLGSFATVPLPGGAAAIREPWRIAASYLRAAYGDEYPEDLAVIERNRERWGQVLSVASSGVNSPETSSAGRLFDAVAAIVGVRDAVNYEGQAAIELEQLVDLDESRSYPVTIHDDTPFRIDAFALIRAMTDDVLGGAPPGAVAGRFHNAVVDAMVSASLRVRDDRGLHTVALSGGVFQNAVLVERGVRALEAEGFEVLTHRRVPPNDGGISLGQVVVAVARDG